MNYRVKGIMANVDQKLRKQYQSRSSPNPELVEYVRENVSKIDENIRKQTTIGVFGKAGAGKSSLINAVLGESQLLPSGTLCACTSVIIQVAANVTDSSYTAEIEFISKQEWQDELSVLGEEEDDEMLRTAKEKVEAVYGEKGCSMSLEDLMKDENFSLIPEFLNSSTKIISTEEAAVLSDQIQCFVQNQDDESPGGYFWPLVKCVTIRVPNCKDFLEHIVIVDLPGTGDYNESRDQMWRSKLRECSTVWIVSEMNRALADKDAWEMISNRVADMAEGGECSSISFICTKCDDINPENYMRSNRLKDGDLQITATDPKYNNKKRSACILHRNDKAKEKVKKNFNQQHVIKKHFNCDDSFLSVFTVSSAQFFEESPILKAEETEILMLRELLRKYNNSHKSDTRSQFISGSNGIISLIQNCKDNNDDMGDSAKMNYRGVKRRLENERISTASSTTKYPKQCLSSQHTEMIKGIMANVDQKLRKQYQSRSSPNPELVEYVRKSISKLDENVGKQTTIGVFGKTGAGKSLLINAVLGESQLLPLGTLCACTSALIQVEANVTDSSYTAEIEFISKQEWQDELKALLSVLGEEEEYRDAAMLRTAKEKVVAVYGEAGCSMSLEDLMKDGNFSLIPEFLDSSTKIISTEEAAVLSDQIQCFVQNQDDKSPGGYYWPLVKRVTIRVPNCKEFLEHIVIVDLPGTGDYNESRDQMWRSKLREYSTVWIVSEINHAVADEDAWEMISNRVADMAAGGKRSSISFICTKCDDINPQDYMRSSRLKDEDFKITAKIPEYNNKKRSACILHRNDKAKKKVKKCKKKDVIKKHFNCDDSFLSVFTVSSAQFFEESPILKAEETEVLKLRELLGKYNSHKRSKFISGSSGILSLIQGCKDNNDDMRALKSRVYDTLVQNLYNANRQLRHHCRNVCQTIDDLLTNGAKESEEKCVDTARKLLQCKDGRGFHKTVTALCKNDGFYRSKTGITDVINVCLAEHMFKHINEGFSEVFPVQGEVSKKSLHAKIEEFTIIPEELITEFQDSPMMCHMLKFIETEEIKLKTFLKHAIVQRKKEMYISIPESIKTTMEPCYEKAAVITGRGSMKQKQDMLLSHIESSRNIMFHKAKWEMQGLLEDTMDFIVGETTVRLLKSAQYFLLNSNLLNIDVSTEVEQMKMLSGHAMD